MHVPSLKLFALTLTAIGILSVSSLAVTLNSVTISAPPFTTPYTVRVGGAIQLIATANYSDGTHTNVTALATWTSSNIQVASVNTGPASSGGITSGVKAGSATVVAAYSGKQGNASLTVNQVAIPANFF